MNGRSLLGALLMTWVAGASLFVATLLFVAIGNAFVQGLNSGSSLTARTYAEAAVHAAPGLRCLLRPNASPAAAGISVATGDDGYARFRAARAIAGSRTARQTLSCRARDGAATSYPVDLSSAATFGGHALQLAEEKTPSPNARRTELALP